MKLLLDENLSPVIVGVVGGQYPGSTHVSLVAKTGAADADIWQLAKDGGFAIVSKDSDFRQRSFLEGAPPKIVWLSVGNAGTREIISLLLQRKADLERFDADAEASVLVVSMS